MQKFFELTTILKSPYAKNFRKKDYKEQVSLVELDDEVDENVSILNGVASLRTNKYNISYLELYLSNDKILHSIIQTTTLELKPLLEQLPYIYLDENETLLVIISKSLSPVQQK